MNQLLPSKNELLPIVNDWETFYDSAFNDSFDNLSFKKKLQMLVDIVRETVLYEEFPNPFEEEDKLIGDSYTACKILVNYLYKMGIGSNYRIVLTPDSIFDKNPSISTHYIVLVEYKEKIYQADCTPSIGYKRGQVEEIGVNNFYDYYISLNNSSIESLDYVRTLLYKISNENINDDLIYNYINYLKLIQNDPITNGYVYKCLNLLYAKATNTLLKQKIKKFADEFLLQKINEERILKDGIFFADNHSYEYIKLLKEELDTLVREDKNYRRQLEIAQFIMYEIIKYNKEYDKKLILNNRKVSFMNITPRLFLHTGFNVVLLKPSAYKANVDLIIKNRFSRDNFIGEYYPNLGKKSELLGLMPMRLFHPVGYKYERSMYGPGDLFLIKAKAEEIKKIKKELRNSLAKEFDNKIVEWYDGGNILWDSRILNLVHTTDDPCEAGLHYLAGYPEYQVMTRFMYPNPNLSKLEKVR